MSAEQSEPAPLHPRAFKLRFAAPHEPGRSYVSAVKPLRLPSVVRGAGGAGGSPGCKAEAEALIRVRALFATGPRERLAAPQLASHEYGWWWDRVQQLDGASYGDHRLQHHIHDSAWLKERLRVLATDNGLKRP